MRYKYILVISTFILLFLSILSCTPDTTISANVISGSGTVTYISLEGGFYAIIADSGINLDCYGLEDEFQVDGLRVEFRAELFENAFTAHQWGILARILWVKKIEE